MAIGLGPLLSIGGALLAGSGRGESRPQISERQLPKWQIEAIQRAMREQGAAARRPLSDATRGNIDQFMGMNTINQMGNLITPDSVLGRAASGDFIGSDRYNQLLSDSNARIKEQFNDVTMPGVLGRFNTAGRIGSPSMMRSAEQAQAGLARGIAQNEASLLRNERQRQLNAVNSMNTILGQQNQIAGNRATLGLQLDPSMIQQRRLQGMNSILQGNYGGRYTTPSVYNRGGVLGSALMGAGGMAGKYGWGENIFGRRPQVGGRGSGGIYIGQSG